MTEAVLDDYVEKIQAFNMNKDKRFDVVHIKDAVMAGYNICRSECEKSDLEIAIRIGALEEENTKLKQDIKTAYVKGIRHMAKALKDYDRTEGAWTDYFEHTVDKVLKKELGEVDNEQEAS